jgi:hypothetical protein
MSTTIDSTELKRLVKEAVAEALREERGALRHVIEDVVEEVALARAMQEADGRDRVSREVVIGALKGWQ